MNNPKAIVRDWFLAEKGGKNLIQQREEIKNKKIYLYGRTYGHENYDELTTEFQDGHRIITSLVVEVDWKTLMVKTESGSVYQLQGPEGSLENYFGFNK